MDRPADTEKTRPVAIDRNAPVEHNLVQPHDFFLQSKTGSPPSAAAAITA